nr:cobalamin-dependent protein [Rhodothermus marinus]
MRRLLQASGAEVIHLGHNRSVHEIVETAIQEDVQGIAVSSYQGGHMEFFKYMIDLLRERGASHIKVFGGGGGVIVPEEIRELEATAFARSSRRRTGCAWACRAWSTTCWSSATFRPCASLKQKRWSGCGSGTKKRWPAY